MTTGRIDYSPDYKSTATDAKTDAAFEAIYRRYGTNLSAFFEDAYKAQRERANKPDATTERAQLERAVVGAAKTWRERNTPQWGTEAIRRAAALESAIDALLEFEAKQDQK